MGPLPNSKPLDGRSVQHSPNGTAGRADLTQLEPAGPPDLSPSAAAAEAIRLELCNGCGQPRSEWGPVCPGMTQGDWTHYHSASYWRQPAVLERAGLT
jgi:hypothetical protein